MGSDHFRMNRRRLLRGGVLVAGAGAALVSGQSARATYSPVSLNVRDYGAHGDNYTDDTVAFQTAMNVLTSGGILDVPPGNYIASGGLTIPQGVSLRGAGFGATYIKSAGNAHILSTVGSFNTIEGIYFYHYGTPASAGSAIHLLSGGQHVIKGCVIDGGFFDNIHVTDAYGYTIGGDGTTILSAVRAEIYHDSVAIPDRGDSVIDRVTFNTTNNTPYAIYWTAGGGLRVRNSKFLGHQTAFCGDLRDGVITSGLYVEGGSFEGQTLYALRVKRQGSTGILGLVQIHDVEVAVQSGDGISIESPSISYATVRDNTVIVNPGKITIAFRNGVTLSSCDGNTLTGSPVHVDQNCQVAVGAGNVIY